MAETRSTGGRNSSCKAADRRTTTPSKHSLRLALEPRMVFDASVAVTALDAVDHGHGGLADAAKTPAAGEPGPEPARAGEAQADHGGTDHGGAMATEAPALVPGSVPGSAPGSTPVTGGVASGTERESMPSGGILQLVFVDPRTLGAEDAASGLGAGTQVVRLDASRDGIQQISEALSRHSGLQSIHILSHGNDAGLPVGRDTLTSTALTGRADEVASWRDHLADGADIRLHGADTAGGQRLAGMLADLTGTRVTATDDLTVAGPVAADPGTSDPGTSDPGTAALDTVTDRRIVVIDARVPNPEILLGDRPVDVETIVIGADDDAIARIQAALAGGRVSLLQIVAHGEAGSLTLGRDRLTAASLEGATAEAVAAWRGAFTEDADILLLGCDVGQGVAGAAFVARLADLTGADVAASDDATGAAALGGDWILEVSTGPIESRIALSATAEAAWQHLLAPPTITSPAGGDTITVIEPSVLNAAGAEQVSLGGWTVTDAEDGTLTVTVSMPGTTVGHLDDTAPSGRRGESTLSFTGKAAEVNGWLAGLRFVAADTELGNTAATTTITIRVADDETVPNIVQKTIAVTVSPSNDPTVLTTSQVTVTEGGHVTITAGNLTVADPEVTAGTQANTQIVYRLEALPAYGTLALDGELLGVGSIFTQNDVVSNRLVYTHKATGADQNTADRFQVSVNDGATPQSWSSANISTVDIAVTPVNQAPVLTTAGGSVFEGVPAGAPDSSIGNFIVANAGGDPGDTVTIQLTSLPQHGALIFTGTLTIDGAAHTLTGQDLATYVVPGPGGGALDLGRHVVMIGQDQLSGLHYAHDGTEPGVAPTDSFNVVITDTGGGTGVPASVAQAITLVIRPVNDDPTWDGGSSLTATVTAGGADGDPLTGADNFRVTLTTAMLNVTDSDSAASSITFAVVDSPSHGRILRDGALVGSGGTFSLQDVIDGRVVYLQTAVNMAGTLDADDFTFAVSDNAMALRWNADGSSFSRQGGIYTGPNAADPYRIFTFTVGLAQGTGAITAGYIVNAGTPSLTEGDSGTQTVTFTVTRVGDISTVGSVQYTVEGVNGADVASPLSGTLVFAANQPTAEITLTLLGDTVVEPDEVMTVTLSNPVQGQIVVGSASTTIVNDDTGLTVSIDPAAAAQFEGNDGPRSYSFTITRAGVLTGTTTVEYVIEGTGDYPVSADDFAGGVFPGGTITFLAGETEKTVTIEVRGDSVAEPDETFQLRLVNPAGAVLTTGTAMATIIDDDPAPGLSVATDAGSVAIQEGNGDGRTLTFTVTRTGKLGQPTTVEWAVVAVSAGIDGADFGQADLPQGMITFAAGETVKTITVTVAGDEDVEGNEIFAVRLSNPVNGTLESPEAQATILDDDPAVLPVIDIAAVTDRLAEGDSGAVAFTFVVTRSGNTSQPGSVDWAVGGGQVNAADFHAGVLPRGTIEFAANEVSRTISVVVRGDTVDEADESFTVTLFNERYGIIGTGTASATIVNDDAVPTLSIRANQGAMVEGNGSTRDFVFTVTRSSRTGTASVDWSVSGTVDAADFGGTIPFGRIDFADGETTKLITIAVTGDTQAELDETLTVTLANAAGARIATAAATSLVVNDDYPHATVSIEADVDSVEEGDSGPRTITYTVTRSGDTTGPASVAWSITAGTADAADFLNGVLPSGTVEFGANETSKTFQIQVNGDTDIEPDETFTVTLSNPNGASIAGGGRSATVSILNDDGQTFAITADQTQMAEGDGGSTPFTFTVTRTGDSSDDVTLDWAVSGPGVDGADFAGGTLPSGTVTIRAGQTSATITVNVAGDTVKETNEGFAVTLSNPSAGTIAVARATSLIVNDDGLTDPMGLPQFDIVAVNGSQVEGGDGTSRSYVFTITRTGDISGLASVEWSVLGDVVNPADAADFGGALPRGTLTFNPGETFQTIVVTVNGDTLAEPDERFTVTLANAVGAGIGTGIAEATILDDDPVPHVSIVDAGLVQLEGNSGATAFTFTVTRTGSTTDVTTVDWQLTGDAVNAADFGGILPFGTVTFAAGQTTATIIIAVTGDTTAEGDEPFTITLLSASNGIIDHATATATILNDDPDVVPTLAIAVTDASKAEGNGEPTSFTFTVTRTGDTSSTSFVRWALHHAGTDAADIASPTSGLVEFAAGATTATITITVNGDLTFEGDESFNVVLSGAVGARIATGTATATILNDDPAPPSIAIATAGVAAYEGQSGTTPFTFTVTRTGDLTRATTVAWTVAGSGGVPAVASDFENGVFPSGTVTFAVGEATATITVHVAGDTTVETNETFTVQLISATNGTISGSAATAVGTIRNDDAPPPPSAEPSQILFVGQNPDSAINAGTILEGSTTGGLILGNDADPSTPVMLSYGVAGASSAQIVYTVLKLGANGGDWYGSLQIKVNGDWKALSAYGTFTQADLDAGNLRFVPSDGEGFLSTFQFSVSTGAIDPVTRAPIRAVGTFSIFTTPVNDAPTARGSADRAIKEGDTSYITTAMLSFADPDDVTNESYLENPTSGVYANNFALNHTAANPLTFRVTVLPAHGTLQVYDGTRWVDVQAGTLYNATLLTNSAGTTGLRYVHNGGETRADAFTVVAVDRWGLASNAATVSYVLTNVNDGPQIAQTPAQADPAIGADAPNAIGGAPVNEPITVEEGGRVRITAAMLQAYDPDSSAVQVQYRLTTATSYGQLMRSTNGTTFTAIGVGSSFTQKDIADGTIYYVHGGGETYQANPSTIYDDRFVFTLSDGDKEETAREAWILITPINQAPTLTGPTPTSPNGYIPVVSTTIGNNPIAGFVATDPDIATTPGYQSTDRSNPVDETDAVTAIVRLRDSAGALLTDYTGITLQRGGAAVTLIDPDGAGPGAAYDGNGRVLVMKGSLAQVNAALAGLRIGFDTDRNAYYTVEVIIDDRARADDGSLIGGTLTGGANGGRKNDSGSPSVANPAVPDTDPDFTSGDFTGLTGNAAIASVRIFVSTTNDPPTIGLPGAIQPTEDVRIAVIDSNRPVDFDDIEARLTGSDIQVTLKAAHGTLDVGMVGSANATGQNVTITGDGTATVTVTGKVADVKAYLNAGVWYLGDTHYNGADTLTVTVSDLGAYGAGAGTSNVAQVAQGTIALTDFVDVNDDITVKIGTGQIVIDRTGPVSIPGMPALASVITDVDDPSQAGQVVQAIVRLLGSGGTPLANAAAYSGITIGYTATGSLAVVDCGAGAFNGVERPLILRGTIAEVAAALRSLTLTVANSDGSRDDSTLTLQVIVDDRTSDASGNVSATANGGAVNQQLTGPSGTPTAIAATAIDPYTTTTTTLDSATGLAPNTAHAERSVYISGINDPVAISAADVAPKTEGVTTIVLNGSDGAFSLSDVDTNGATNLTATVTTSAGTFTAVGGTAGKSTLGLGTITLTGSLAAIESSLRALTITLPDPDGPGGPATGADWNGTFTVTVSVEDKGNTGQRPADLSGLGTDPTSNPGRVTHTDGAGGSSASLTTTRTITVTVTNVNDAPIRSGNATVGTLPNTQEDTAEPPGAKVDTLFAASFSDPRDAAGAAGANQFHGVAVVSTGTVSGGVWQYSRDTDGDGTPDGPWTTIGALTASNALILGRNDAIRFRPDANWFGTPDGLTVRLIDNSGTPPASGSTVDIGTGGGSTAYSNADNAVTLTTAVVKLNDRPTASGTTLPDVAEDTTDPSGSTISGLFAGKYSDAADDQSATGGGNDATPLAGIAIVGNTTPVAQGVWQYRYDANQDGDYADGGVETWTTIAANSYSDAFALILPAAAQLRFLPGTDFNGTVTPLSIRVADGEGGAISAVTDGAVLSGALGPTSRWSGDSTVSIGVTVTPVNDAPTITASAIASPIPLSEAAGVGTGSSSQLLVTVSAVGDAADFQYLANDNFGGGVITATMASWYDGDRLSVVDGTYSGKAVTYASSQVKVEGTLVGTVAGGSGGTALTITLNAAADAAAVQAVIQAIAYRTTSDNPTANGAHATRRVDFTFTDGANDNQSGGAALPTNPSSFVSATIQFTPVNDPPVVDLNGAGDGANNEVTFIDPANGTPVPVNIAASATLADPDNSNLSSMRLVVGGLQDGALETLTIAGKPFTLNQDYTDAAAGAFKVTYVASTGTFTILPGSGNTATVAAFQALLRGITYLDTDDDPTGTTRTIHVTVTDANDDDASATGLDSNTPHTTITIQANNDQPRITGLSGTATFSEDAIKTAARLDADGAITLVDADSTAYGGGTLKVTGMISGQDSVSLPQSGDVPANPSVNQIWRDGSNGVHAYDGSAWVRIGTVTDSPTTFTVTLTANATKARVEALIGALTYRNGSDAPTLSRTLSVTLTEAGGAGITQAATIAVTVSPENDAPRVTANNVMVAEGAATLVLDGSNANITVTEVDGLSTQAIKATVSLSTGIFSAVGGSGGTVTGTNTDTLTFTGLTLAELNSRLKALTIAYPVVGGATTADWNGAITVTVVVEDLGNLGSRPAGLEGDGNDATTGNGDFDYVDGSTGSTDNKLKTTRSFVVTVTPVNDAPTAAITGTYTVNEDATLALGSTLSVSDALDVPFGGVANATVSVTVGVQHGTLTLGGDTATLTSANGVATLTLSGTLAAVNTALQNLTYAPTRDYSGSDTLTLTVNDGANGGTGALSNTATKTITIAPVSDTPDLTINGTLNPSAAVTVTGNEDSDISIATVIGETDTLGVDETISFTLDGIPAGWVVKDNGTPLTLVANGDGTFNTGVLSGDKLATLTIRPPQDWNAQQPGKTAPTLTITAYSSDQGATAATRTGTIVLNVAPVSDDTAPTNDTDSLTEDTASVTKTAAAGVLSNDSDVDLEQTLSVQGVAAGNTGTALTDGTGVGSAVTGTWGQLTLNADGSYSYQLDTASVQFLRDGQTRTDVFTYTVNDTGKLGTPKTATLTITINGLNDAPVVDLNGAATGTDTTLTYTEVDGTDSSTGTALWPSATLSDPDSGKLASLTITAGNILDGNAEILRIGGTDFALGTSTGSPVTVTAGATSFQVGVAASGTGAVITITPASGGAMAITDTATLLAGITYRDISDKPNTNGTRGFAVQVTDAGSNDDGTPAGSRLASNTATATVTVVTTNEAPVVDLNGADAGSDNAVTYTEVANGTEPELAIAAAATLADVDNANLTRMVLTVGSVADGAQEFLTIGGTRFAIGTDVTAQVVDAGTLGRFSVTIATTGGNRQVDIRALGAGSTAAVDTKADFAGLLRGITYSNTSDNPSGTRTIRVQVTDAGTDDAIAADDERVSNQPTVTISFVAVNDQPRFSGTYQDRTVRENAVNVTGGAPVALIGNPAAVTLNDADSPNYVGGSITVSGLAADDVLSLPATVTAADGAVRLSGGTTVQVHANGDWRSIGTLSGGNGATLTIAINGADAATYGTVANVERVIEALTYQNGSDRPTPGPRTLTISVNDGGAGVAGTTTVALTVVPENDRPVIGNFGSAGPTFTEDGAAVLLDADATLFDADIGDASGGPNDYRGVTLTFQRSGGTPNAEDVFGFSGGAATANSVYANGTELRLANGTADPSDDRVTGSIDTTTAGRLRITLGGTAAVTQDVASRVIQAVTYANLSENVDGVSAGPVSIDLTVDDRNGAAQVNQGDGGALTATATTSVTIVPVNEPIRTGTAPTLTQVAYAENAAPQRLFNDAAVTITDNDNSTFNGGLVTASFTSGGQASDRLVVVGSGDAASNWISVSGTDVLWDADGAGPGAAVIIGTLSGGTDAATALNIALNGNAVPAAVQALIRQIAFANGSDDPVGGAAAIRTVSVDVRNGAVGAPTTQTATGLFTNTVLVTPENDAPVIDRADGSTILGSTITEWDGTGTYSDSGDTVAALVALLGTDAHDADNRAGGVGTPTDGLGLAVTGVLNTDGRWQYSTDGTSWTDIPAGTSATAALLLNPTDRVRFVPTALFNGDAGARLTLKLWDRTSSGTDTTADDANTTDGDRNKGDNDQFSGRTVVLTARVSAVNDAPVNTVPTTLTGIREDTAFTFSGSNAFSIADVDVNENPDAANRTLTITLTAQHGVLTLGDATTRAGVAFTSGDGVTDATVTATGTLANLQALLASVTYKGNADFNGTDSITITTNDRGNYGSGGALQDVDTITFTVQAVNDAPTATSTATVTLAPVAEDIDGMANSGSTVSDLFAARLTDAPDAPDAVTGGSSANSFAGIAIVAGTADAAKWQWQYQIGGAGAWTDVGDRTLASALLLGSGDRLRFQPAGDFNGPAPQLGIRLVEDGGAAISGGTVLDLGGATATGGETRYADAANQLTLATSVTAVNDRPVVTGSGPVAIPVTEDTTPAGATFASLLAGRYTDATDDQTVKGGSADATALSFVAVVGNTSVAGQGTWQYLANGTTWTDIPTTGLSAASALVLDAAMQVRFVPAADFHGTPGALTLRLADGSANPVTASGSATDLKDLSANGGTGLTGRWSLGGLDLQPTVGNVNDAPTASGTATLPAIAEDTAPASIPGATVASLFGPLYGDAADDRTGVTGGGDASTHALAGVAIVGNAATAAQGQWWYSTDGTSWTALPANLSDTNALVLPTTASLRFVPVADWNGTPGGLTVRLSDATVGAAASGQTLAIGGSNQWSATTVTLGTSVTAVEDAIEAANDSNGILEDAAAPATGNVLANDFDRDSLGTLAPQTLYVTAIQGTGATATAIDTSANNSVTVSGRYGTLTIKRDGSYSYALDSSLDVIQRLRQGQTLNDEVFIYTVDDVLAADGSNVGSAAVSRTLTITITGVNDVPVAKPDTGAIQEDATAPATGTVLANDVEIDAGDPGTVTAVGFGATVGTALGGAYGSLTLKADGTWSYAIDNGSPAVQALADGETLTETFTYTVTDTAGAGSSSTLTIAITGTNDAPVIGTTGTTGAVVEDASSPTLTSNGTIGFTDLDLTNTHTVTVGTATVTVSAGIPTGFVPATGFGTLTASVVEDATDASNAGQITWSFAVDNAAVQGLAAGEMVTQVYTLTLKDSSGATVTHDVTITITGTNDAPIVGIDKLTGAVIEDASATVLTDTGTIDLGDADLSDTHGVAVAFNSTTGAAQLGKLVAVVQTDSSGTGTGGTIAWTYGVDNAAVQFLAAGQTVTETYTLTVSDGKGGTVTRDVTVTITGTNDAPLIGTAKLTGAVTEDAGGGTTLTDTGTIAFTDVDLTDAHSVTAAFVSTSGTGQLGTLTAVRSADTTGSGIGGEAIWTYSVDNAALQFLRAGETVTETYAVTVSDGQGGTVTRNVVVTLTGTNDAPTVTGDPPTVSGNAGQEMALTIDRGRFADVDRGDSLTFTATLADGRPLPSWLSFDPATLAFRGTPPQDAGGTLALALRATDTAGASATLGVIFSITAEVPHSDTPTPITPSTTTPTAPTNPAATPTSTDTLITGSTNATPNAPLFTGSPRTGDGLTTGFAASPLTQVLAGDSGGFGAGLVNTASLLNRQGNGDLSTSAIFRQTSQANVELFLAGSVGNHTVLPEQQASFQVPKNIFRHTNPNERLVFQAVRPDGSPLPNWLQFDAQNLSFRGVPPAQARGALDIVIVAKDSRGNQAAAQFRILVTQDLNTQAPVGNGRGEQPSGGEGRPQAQGQQPPGEGQGEGQGQGQGQLQFQFQFQGGQPNGGQDGKPGEPALQPPKDQRADAGVPDSMEGADAWTITGRSVADAAFGAEPLAGRASFTAQLHAAGRPGLLAEARSLLNALLVGDDRDAA